MSCSAVCIIFTRNGNVTGYILAGCSGATNNAHRASHFFQKSLYNSVASISHTKTYPQHDYYTPQYKNVGNFPNMAISWIGHPTVKVGEG